VSRLVGSEMCIRDSSTTESIGGTSVDARVLRRISRRASASPATGNHHLHEDEAKALMDEAFTR
jgi:2-oxoglutarate decarboxylase